MWFWLFQGPTTHLKQLCNSQNGWPWSGFLAKASTCKKNVISQIYINSHIKTRFPANTCSVNPVWVNKKGGCPAKCSPKTSPWMSNPVDVLLRTLKVAKAAKFVQTENTKCLCSNVLSTTKSLIIFPIAYPIISQNRFKGKTAGDFYIIICWYTFG